MLKLAWTLAGYVAILGEVGVVQPRYLELLDCLRHFAVRHLDPLAPLGDECVALLPLVWVIPLGRLNLCKLQRLG